MAGNERDAQGFKIVGADVFVEDGSRELIVRRLDAVHTDRSRPKAAVIRRTAHGDRLDARHATNAAKQLAYFGKLLAVRIAEARWETHLQPHDVFGFITGTEGHG